MIIKRCSKKINKIEHFCIIFSKLKIEGHLWQSIVNIELSVKRPMSFT